MKDFDMDNLRFSNNILSDINGIFLLSNNESISDVFKSDSKREFPIKQQIKFISTKQESHPINLLHKKTILKPNDYSTDTDNSNSGRWSKEEQERFAEAVLKYGNDWKNIQNHVSSRNITQVRSHAQKFLTKLKESNFLLNKGLDPNLSWTKIMNYLNTTLTYDELKEVIFSVEKTGQNKSGNINCQNSKKKQNKKNINKVYNSMNNTSKNDVLENNNCCYKDDYLNLDEEKDNINNKMIKDEEDEEDEKELQKFIKCFNSPSSEITLNSSFEEILNKEEEDIEDNFLNKEKMKYNKYLL